MSNEKFQNNESEFSLDNNSIESDEIISENENNSNNKSNKIESSIIKTIIIY